MDDLKRFQIQLLIFLIVLVLAIFGFLGWALIQERKMERPTKEFAIEVLDGNGQRLDFKEMVVVGQYLGYFTELKNKGWTIDREVTRTTITVSKKDLFGG
jgi:hypothetical protein